jgi:hypothetical protein
MAASEEFGLLAFQRTASGSRLAQIDPGTSTASLLSPPLFGRSIRGATFNGTDELWVVDVALDQLVRVSPITGEELEVIPLVFNALPFDAPLAVDLATNFAEQLLLVAGQEVYSVNETSGQMSLLFTDTQGEPEPASSQPPNLVGAVVGFSGSESLFALDVEGSFADDLYTYDLAAGFHRELLIPAPLPNVDAALGDLALLTQSVGSGDYNGNGVVDAADYIVWRDSLGSTTILNANGNDRGTSMGIIDLADYEHWRSRFGNVATAVGSGSTFLASVPEPSGFVLWLFAAVMVSAWVRDYRRYEPHLSNRLEAGGDSGNDRWAHDRQASDPVP